VSVGSRVRVLAVPVLLKRDLPADEWAAVESMLGEVFEVNEIDEWGQAWVQKWWGEGDGVKRSHSIGLDPHEMERVDPC
jgi:hypothetical protein